MRLIDQNKKLLLRQKILSKLVSSSLIEYGLKNYSQKLINQLKKGKLISKILKEKYFWKWKFYTSNNTLDPREDTEKLIEIFIEYYKNKFHHNKKYTLLDCCTGTGAIGISLNLEFENLRVTYLDISHKALQICKKNIRFHKLWHKSKIYKTPLEKIDKNLSYDFLVSNPPYLLMEEIKNNHKILSQDPFISLYGGVDGLYFYKLLASYIKNNIKYGAFIEIDHNRKDEIYNIFNEYQFKSITLYEDNYGLWRVLSIEI